MSSMTLDIVDGILISSGSPRRGTRDFYYRRWADMMQHRRRDESRWRKIQELVNGETGVYLETQEEQRRNVGDFTNINPGNSVARMAAKTLATGLMATVCNPARRYLHFEPLDITGVREEEGVDMDEVKGWLAKAENAYYAIQADTNWYEKLNPLFLETGMYGQSAIGGEEHDASVVRYTSYAVGQFCIADNEYGETTTFMYRYDATVEQIINRFVLSRPKNQQARSFKALPEAVRNNWRDGKYDKRHEIIHGFIPNDDADIKAERRSLPSANLVYRGLMPQQMAKDKMPVKEISFMKEVEGSEYPEDLLDVKYHSMMPVWVPRWNMLPNSQYATGPGWEALSSVMRLGELLEAEGEALEQMNSPAVQAPASMRDQYHQVNLTPSAVNFTDTMGGDKIEPIFHHIPNLHHFAERIAKAENDVREQFHNDLFNRISIMDKVSATAEQISITDRERILQLAPIAERLTRELLLPHAHWMLDKMVKSPNVDLEMPPEPLQGFPYRVRFSNIVSIAQQSEAVLGAREWLATATNLAGVPSWNRLSAVVDEQRLGRAMAEALDLPPEVLRNEKELKQWNAQQDEMEQAQAQAAAQTEESVAAKNYGAAEKDRAAAQQTPGAPGGPA